MVPRKNSRAICSRGEEDVAADSQNQQHAKPQLARFQRKKRRQKTSGGDQRGDQTRVLQVYKFRSRAPCISVPSNGRGSSGLSRTPALPKDGNIVEMLARSASYWLHQEPARCWVRDCTCLKAGHPSRKRLQHHLLGEEDSLASLIREESFSTDEVSDGSTGDTGSAISQTNVESDDSPRSFAEEYSLVPLSQWNIYSAESFDQQVQEYFRRH